MRVSDRHPLGFTLIELLVVMSIMALLLAIAAPRYFASIDHAKEVALRTNLKIIRDCLDRYRTARGRAPDALSELVSIRCVRTIPEDAVAGAEPDWVLIPHPDGITPGIYDIRSSSQATAGDGTKFADW